MSVLKVNNISKTYKDIKALDNVSFTLQDGITALLGNNGSGKSTLINIIVGLLKPDCGSVVFNDLDNAKNGAEFRKNIGFLPQDCGYYENFSAYEFLRYMGYIKGMEKKLIEERIQKYLNCVNLWQVRKKRIRKFSGGMKHRLGIAQAFLDEPKLIILDEPTTGLDAIERESFKKMLEEYGKNHIIIISTHIMSDVEGIVNNTIILENGKIK